MYFMCPGFPLLGMLFGVTFYGGLKESGDTHPRKNSTAKGCGHPETTEWTGHPS